MSAALGAAHFGLLLLTAAICRGRPGGMAHDANHHHEANAGAECELQDRQRQRPTRAPEQAERGKSSDDAARPDSQLRADAKVPVCTSGTASTADEHRHRQRGGGEQQPRQHECWVTAESRRRIGRAPRNTLCDLTRCARVRQGRPYPNLFQSWIGIRATETRPVDRAACVFLDRLKTAIGP